MANFNYTLQKSPNVGIGSGILAQSIPTQLQGLTTAQLTALGPNTIGQFGNVSIDLGSSKKYHADVKKYEIYESPEDILALSVAWKRCRDNNDNTGCSNLLDPLLFKALTHEDQVVADKIRDYYSKKVMMWKLKGTQLSRYRDDLNTFIHADGKKFREQAFGLVYYLPEFYSYDTSLDEVRLQVNTKIAKSNEITGKTLKPLKRIVKKNKSCTKIQYWLKDNETDGAVLVSIDPKNPLEHIWIQLFDTKELLRIKGQYYTHDKYDFEYFNIKNWHLSLG